MNERIPAVLQPLLALYLQRVERLLPGFVPAFYLVGSIALGEFNPRLSDVDFVATLSRQPSPEDVRTLHQIHLEVENEIPNWKLEGMYFQPGDIGRAERCVPPYLAYYKRGLRARQESHLAGVTWWILKNHGIAARGADPRELHIHVDWDELLAQMKENLHTYWAGWTNRPGRLVKLYAETCVQWTVLGVLRQFYSFRERSITTKVRAGEYGLACLPGRFHPIIREAICLRQCTPRSSTYRSRLVRAVHAVRLVRWVMCEAR